MTKSQQIFTQLQRPSGLLLLLTNLVPLAGVYLFNWYVSAILVIYWLESVIIGVLNIPKILSAREDGAAGPFNVFGNLFTAIFFTFHYGMFTGVHGVFVATMFGGGEMMLSVLQGGALFWTAISFFASHLFSMFINFYGKKEYLGRTAGEQMFRPYGRVMVMHIVILFGGFLVQSMGDPIYALLLLIGLKTIIDLAAHGWDHKNAAAPTTAN